MSELNNRREQKFVGRMALLFAITSTVSISCAHVTSRLSSSRDKPAHVISMDAHGDPLNSLEQELTSVHSDRVIVSTALLRALVRNERTQQNQCRHISGQLEALKNIDLEETGLEETGKDKE